MASVTDESVTEERVREALGSVIDPEIKRPVTELGMVDTITIDDTSITVRILLTVSGCPLKETLTRDTTEAVQKVAPQHTVHVDLGVMTDEQRKSMREMLRGGQAEREIPFAQAGSLTKVYAIASGKGGVGKSSVTVNLAVAMAQRGLKVGIVDADIYGHSIPDMMGVGDRRPTQVDDMILPVPVAVPGSPDAPDVKVMSIGMLKPKRDQVVAWRGPMLDRALVQMLSDVFWGDLDALLLDLPPGTGDMAISLGQHLSNAEVVVVTTPQQAAAQVAERAGTMASMMHQRVVGVIENMSYLLTPAGERLEVFGSGGAETVARTLGQRLGHDVPVLGKVPLEEQLRIGGDDGLPIVATHPDSESAKILLQVADSLTGRSRGLAGMQLGLAPVGRL
ncbi:MULTISPECIES: Mrp/NBP35 family ATP-binding protein [unclassified Aeromicrobium]|nr:MULTISPECIES: Mrp/NBP35 family ATP-binding protein [unclassified Aeromicrobium]RYY51769.1 MAG: MRP family ATP-binding protein [Actinomycetales bacterium]KQO41767.1 sodium:proton antiporter [Aeromicrobium sp. Leaf245]KQP27099.1 sodium:proton antiporter [Aeromicrobium sp. Leaf272]KQP77120.1 sodium:proton antiporter [Aeromicrobium sp. Leaf289]KQP81153.1 sodium:proton antiporter [Aeromicrobium sp. Leaf291]